MTLISAFNFEIREESKNTPAAGSVSQGELRLSPWKHPDPLSGHFDRKREFIPTSPGPKLPFPATRLSQGQSFAPGPARSCLLGRRLGVREFILTPLRPERACPGPIPPGIIFSRLF